MSWNVTDTSKLQYGV